jgi:hypothetical protein
MGIKRTWSPDKESAVFDVSDEMWAEFAQGSGLKTFCVSQVTFWRKVCAKKLLTKFLGQEGEYARFLYSDSFYIRHGLSGASKAFCMKSVRTIACKLWMLCRP